MQNFVSWYDFSELIDVCDDIAITSRLVQWVSIPEFQLGDPGSIPGMGAYFLLNGHTLFSTTSLQEECKEDR